MSNKTSNQPESDMQTRVENFLSNVDADYHWDWSEPAGFAVLFVRDELEHSKNGIRRAIIFA